MGNSGQGMKDECFNHGHGGRGGKGASLCRPQGTRPQSTPLLSVWTMGRDPASQSCFGEGLALLALNFLGQLFLWIIDFRRGAWGGGCSACIGPYPIIQGLLQPGSGMTGQHCQDNSPTESALEGWLESCPLC